MKSKSLFRCISLFITIALLSIACGRKSGGGGSSDKQPSAPTLASNGPDVSIHADATAASAEPGFYFTDLLKSYCSVTFSSPSGPAGNVVPAGTSLLISDFIMDGWISVLLPDQESREVGGMISTMESSVATSSCVLNKALDKQETAVLLASVKLYATDDRQGDPICALKAGPLTGGELNVTLYDGKHSWQVEIPDQFKQLCGGVGFGYSEKSPNDVTLVSSSL